MNKKRIVSLLAASWMMLIVVVAQHRGFYAAMVLSFSAAVALVLDKNRYTVPGVSKPEL
jgi:hypothetical protein